MKVETQAQTTSPEPYKPNENLESELANNSSTQPTSPTQERKWRGQGVIEAANSSRQESVRWFTQNHVFWKFHKISPRKANKIKQTTGPMC